MSEEKRCPICRDERVPTENWGRISEGPQWVVVYKCPRCGRFAITLLHSRRVEDISNEERRKVTAYLRERNFQEQEGKLIVVGFGDHPEGLKPGAIWVTWEDAVAAFPQTPAERLDRTLLNLSRLSVHLGSPIGIDAFSEPLAFAENNEEMWFIFKQLIDDELLKPYGSEIARLVVTVKGWSRVAWIQSLIAPEEKAPIGFHPDTK